VWRSYNSFREILFGIFETGLCDLKVEFGKFKIGLGIEEFFFADKFFSVKFFQSLVITLRAFEAEAIRFETTFGFTYSRLKADTI
jgi:hypothetical protein